MPSPESSISAPTNDGANTLPRFHHKKLASERQRIALLLRIMNLLVRAMLRVLRLTIGNLRVLRLAIGWGWRSIRSLRILRLTIGRLWLAIRGLGILRWSIRSLRILARSSVRGLLQHGLPH